MSAFARKVIAWQRRAGRHALPWQADRDPYRIWLSEIMLQQTQVSTVIPYFERFIQRFPDVRTLAAAEPDSVMRLWAGLGYYARARNLHRAAQVMVERHGGEFPRTLEAVHALPGIGRSTAAAICAFAFGERAAILDGNVKRVLARQFGIAGDAKTREVENALWDKAGRILPTAGIEAYTQGLMDLGATICTRAAPACMLCPVSDTCVARAEGRIDELPGRSASRDIPHREIAMLVLHRDEELLLERRPPAGIWGGLWSLPEAPVGEDLPAAIARRYGLRGEVGAQLPLVKHAFTHYSLTIHPIEVSIQRGPAQTAGNEVRWVREDEALDAGLPAPVLRLLRARAASQLTSC